MSDFPAVCAALREGRYKWQQIGIELGLSYEDLVNLQDEYRLSERCLSHMIHMWLSRRSLRPTWESLIAALREITVGEEGLAADIEEMYGKQTLLVHVYSNCRSRCV